jgi:hypothetical protein
MRNRIVVLQTGARTEVVGLVHCRDKTRGRLEWRMMRQCT